ncbi:A24 family peptidase C-terminal domain-containing protein [Archaeoglobus veneficus]|uniref:Peptidase A24B, FlaK domain protein n=1 Tax=Archaeoglobus veneficus (strain DSM 11195 / SNP6) TaxID=693661 RepID=F2KPR0_ARCVS|nr:A24 family peptidase C-terminal domain-containing protein [Archaeoglobus veneficus]AEA47588.1 Peptidase A24B, FlaK domain protein [Archaeoglobus veneficus SNP6]
MIALIKIAVALVFLLEACKMDLKERRVPNRLWKLMLLVFLPLDIIEYYLQPFSLTFALFQFAFVAAFCYALYYLGLYGGADAKAIMCLAIAFPAYPSFFVFPLLNEGLGMLAFTTLANSVLAAPFLVAVLLVRNALSGNLEFPYCLIGYKVDARAVPRFHNLLEYVEGGEVKRRLRSIEPTEEMLDKLRKAADKGIVKKVWVTPGLPFLCFITVGFVIAVLVGDLMVWLFSCWF